MMIQPAPQTRWASARAGRFSDDVTASASLPKPVMTPQKTMTRKDPIRTIDRITDSGTLRFGILRLLGQRRRRLPAGQALDGEHDGEREAFAGAG